MRLLLALLAAAALAGCAAPEGMGLSRDALPPEPYYMEYREVVSGEHVRAFDVPVDAGARLANVTVSLAARTNGLPVPDASPASLTATLYDPSGAIVREARVDASRPEASLVLDAPEPGTYRAEVRGVGAAQDVDGSAYGAGYLVSVEVLYAE